MPPKRKLKNIVEALRAALPPVQHGVMCFVVHDVTLMLWARLLAQMHVLTAAPIADVPIGATENVSALYGSASREASLTEELVRSNANPSQLSNAQQVVRLDDCRIFHPTSNEGVHVTLSRLQAHGCVTAEQSIVGTPHDEMIEAIGRLDAGGRERNGLVLLFLYCPPSTDATWIRRHCDEVFVVDKCEPGPGASVAFSMTALSLESQHDNGIGRTMYEISYHSNNWSSKSSAFIAAKAEDRAIWFARREGEYLETIAEWMGVDKSTVKRRQDNLPLRTDIDADVDPPEEWRDEWFPFLGWEYPEDDGDDDTGADEPDNRPKRIA
jgi:hypothetical protein